MFRSLMCALLVEIVVLISYKPVVLLRNEVWDGVILRPFGLRFVSISIFYLFEAQLLFKLSFQTHSKLSSFSG